MIPADAPWRVKFSRNPAGWLASCKLTCMKVVGYAPTSLWWMIGTELTTLIATALMLPLLLAVWIFVFLGQIGAGLAGWLSPANAIETKEQ